MIETNEQTKVEAAVQQFIYNVRLLLVPMYMALAIAVFAFLMVFFKTSWGLMRHFHDLDPELTMLNVLSQLDQVMVANLVVMIIQGSYSTFVNELQFKKTGHKPSWLNHMSAGLLKVKMSMSLMGVSAVGLLPVFLEPSKYTGHDVWIKVTVHMVLMISTLVLWLVTRNEGEHHSTEPIVHPIKVEEPHHHE